MRKKLKLNHFKSIKIQTDEISKTDELVFKLKNILKIR